MIPKTFGVLKIRDSKLVYDFYVAEADGRVTLIDTLRINKGDVPGGSVYLLK